MVIIRVFRVRIPPGQGRTSSSALPAKPVSPWCGAGGLLPGALGSGPLSRQGLVTLRFCHAHRLTSTVGAHTAGLSTELVRRRARSGWWRDAIHRSRFGPAPRRSEWMDAHGNRGRDGRRCDVAQRAEYATRWIKWVGASWIPRRLIPSHQGVRDLVGVQFGVGGGTWTPTPYQGH